MSAAGREEIEVTCPDCALSFEVSTDVIAESQHMLDEYGYCTGPASFECAAPYFAALGPHPSSTHAKIAGVDPLEAALARWETEGGAVGAAH
ncbi:MAG: hypothetical protein ABI467_23035 [Kofleriaceae bacterium]